jgi:tetratricopeptide (TPR) repeat protein
MIPLPPCRPKLRKILLSALIAAILFPSLFLPLFASAQTLTIDADSQFGFAEHLFSDGQFEQAATEFNRFIYFFPDDYRAERALFQAAMSLFKGNHFQEAQRGFSQLVKRGSQGEYSSRSALMIAECRFKLNDIDGAVVSLQQLIHDTKDTAVRDEAWYRLAWIMIETADWQKAKSAFHQLSPMGSEKYRSDKILSGLDDADTLPRKSPALAGFLSVVPGAGHLYCDRPQDATVAFLLNTALAASAWQAFDRDMAWLGGLISFVEIGVYSGTLYSAVGSAHKYNRQKKIEFIEQLKRETTPVLSLSPIQGGFLLSLNVNF